MKNSKLIALALILIVAFTLTACQTQINESEIPNLYYTLMVYSRMPSKAVLSTNEWTKGNQSVISDHISPLEIEFTDYLGLTAGSDFPVAVNIGYDDNTVQVPKVLDVSVNLIESNDEAYPIEAQFTSDNNQTFEFYPAKEPGEYIYLATVKFEQGTVRYAMKIVVEDVTESMQPSDKTIDELPGVTLAIKENTLTDIGLTAVINNASETEFTFGAYYCIEKEIDGEWYQLPFIAQENDVAWHSIGYPVSPNADREFEPTDWKWLYGTLNDGKYRFIKDASVGTGENLTQYYFAVEFTLE